jgi:hypothetical protein
LQRAGADRGDAGRVRESGFATMKLALLEMLPDQAPLRAEPSPSFRVPPRMVILLVERLTVLRVNVPEPDLVNAAGLDRKPLPAKV